MTRLGLALSAFRRHKGRAIFTVLSVAAAFAIFTVLSAVKEGFDGNISLASAQRLMTSTEINAPLPVAYADVVRSIPGVVAVTHLTGFGGYFRDPRQEVGVLATLAATFLTVFPEYRVSADQHQTFLHDRDGAIVGDVLARKIGWHIGETVPIQGGPPQKNGSTTWYFHIDGVYHTELPAGFREHFIVNYDYFNEGLATSSPTRDTVQLVIELVDSPKDMDRIARAIDARFTNASPDTKTESEQEGIMSGMRQFGDIGTIITCVGFAVFLSMLLITGNTMANSVRERMGEFAMMRALGFGRWQIAFLVLRESAILIGVGATLGVLAGWCVSRLMEPVMTTLLLGFNVPWLGILLAAALALLFALVSGLLPCRRVATMPVAATLRRA